VIKSVFDVVVVGSGPSAFSALASIPPSLNVALIDIGKGPAASTETFVSDISNNILANGPSEKTLNRAFHFSLSATQGIGDFKKYFGDDFSYDSTNDRSQYILPVKGSVGIGGFSAVWGSTVLPFSRKDLDLVSDRCKSDLIDGYQEISRLVRIQGKSNECSSYNSYANQDFSFSQSNLVGKIKPKSHKIIDKLNKFEVLSSQLMVAGSNKSNTVSCLSCGLCHVGCPFGVIWDSAVAIKGLDRQFLQQLRGEVIQFSEEENFVRTSYIDNGDWKIVESTYLILCSGPISTARIVMNSNPKISEIRISDSQTYFKQSFSLRKIKNVDFRNTLAEVMCSVSNKSMTTLLAQLYSRSSYSDFRAIKEFPILSKVPRFFLEALLSRVVTALVYLPGEFSGEISVFRGEGKKFTISGIESKKISLQRMIANFKFWIGMFTRGFILLPFLDKKLPIGGGNHIGNSRIFENEKVNKLVDDEGALRGYSRVIIADGSALSRVPAGPITFSIMANSSSTIKKLFSRA
jgi:ferredoxin